MNAWRSEISRFIIGLITGGAIGWAVGYPGWGIAVMATLHGFWMLLRTRELARWVLLNNDDDPPDSGSIWGNLYDHLYQKEKQTQTRIQSLLELVDLARQSTNALRDAVVVVNQYDELEWWNDAAETLLGLKRQTDRGQPITNLVRDPRFIRYFRQRQYEGELEVPSPVNKSILLQLQTVVFGDNNRLLVARDVTRLHHLEQTRKDFVANVSHELRTPLTVIKGYLETFIDLLGPDQTQLRRGMQQMQQQAHRMEMLVSDLLLLSRLETQNRNQPAKPIIIGTLLRQIYQDALALNSDRNHTLHLHVDDEHALMGYESELRSAFSNLVVNAVKYTPDEGEITLRWWVDDEGAHFSVQDNGIGIEPQHLPRLTERFYRADPSRNSKTGGTGLGLAIVKHVLMHHDARLDIVSEPGEGSTFTCHFPRKLLTVMPASVAVAI